MSLYGDLPPAQGEVSADNDTQHSTLNAASISKKITKFSAKSISVPSFAAFKPRQANKNIPTSQSKTFGKEHAAPQKFEKFHDEHHRMSVNTAPTFDTHASVLRDSTSSGSASNAAADEVGIMSYEISCNPYDPGKPNDYLDW
jgi:hypothetical protein